VSSYIEEHRERFGVEPICRTLEVSASAYYERAKGERSDREIEDERLLGRIAEIHERNYCAYGYRRMWIALRREGEEVGRGRVQRLMREAGIQGAKRRGKAWRTTKPPPMLTAGPTWSSATSAPRLPTDSGSATSPTCARGREPCSSPS
jgi:transposase InsO family protein